MNDAYERYVAAAEDGAENTIIQGSSMTEEERESFLAAFVAGDSSVREDEESRGHRQLDQAANKKASSVLRSWAVSSRKASIWSVTV